MFLRCSVTRGHRRFRLLRASHWVWRRVCRAAGRRRRGEGGAVVGAEEQSFFRGGVETVAGGGEVCRGKCCAAGPFETVVSADEQIDAIGGDPVESAVWSGGEDMEVRTASEGDR